MQLGDLVKVFVKPANIWVSGKIVSKYHNDPKDGIIYTVKGDDLVPKFRDFYHNEVRLHRPQSEGDYQAEIERSLPIGLALAKEILQAIEFEEVVTRKENHLLGYYGYVTINPMQYYDPKYNDAFVETTGWEVKTWKFIPATKEEIERRTSSVVGLFPNINLAVVMMVELIFAMRLKDYLEVKGDSCTT